MKHDHSSIIISEQKRSSQPYHKATGTMYYRSNTTNVVLPVVVPFSIVRMIPTWQHAHLCTLTYQVLVLMIEKK